MNGSSLRGRNYYRVPEERILYVVRTGNVNGSLRDQGRQFLPERSVEVFFGDDNGTTVGLAKS